MARPVSAPMTDREKSRAVESYRDHGSIGTAAKAAGVSRQTLWVHRKKDKKFQSALDDAYSEYCEKYEAILDEKILGQGKDAAILLMFKLKAIYPDKYREKVDHKVEGNITIVSGIPRPGNQGVIKELPPNSKALPQAQSSSSNANYNPPSSYVTYSPNVQVTETQNP